MYGCLLLLTLLVEVVLPIPLVILDYIIFIKEFFYTIHDFIRRNVSWEDPQWSIQKKPVSYNYLIWLYYHLNILNTKHYNK